MHRAMSIRLSPENVAKLFGTEAAEDEHSDRFKQYSLKGKSFEGFYNEMPLRIIVGYKGSGKSAILRISKQEDDSFGIPNVWLTHSNINEYVKLISSSEDLSEKINAWTISLGKSIVKQLVENYLHSRIEDNVLAKGSYNFSNKNAIFYNLQTTYFNTTGARLKIAPETYKIKVYIDDIDVGWNGSPSHISTISALLNALRILNRNNQQFLFRITLRSDVYYLVRTSDESTDKFQSNVVFLDWDNHEILVLLVKRVESFFGNEYIESDLVAKSQDTLMHYLKSIISPTFPNWGQQAQVPMQRVLLSLVRRRPRDMVKLCTMAAHQAYSRGSTIIDSSDFRSVFEQYSRDRLQDIINEFKSELPNIDQLLLEMRPTRKERSGKDMFLYAANALVQKLRFIKSHARFQFTGSNITASENDLISFLYKINFLQARKTLTNGMIDRKFFEQNQLLSSRYVNFFGYDFEVHPAYRWALQPSSVEQVLREIES